MNMLRFLLISQKKSINKQIVIAFVKSGGY
jgi:hypothetical protein